MDAIHLEPPRGRLDWLRLYLIYVTSFPRMERKPFERIRTMYDTGRADVWRIRRGKQFLGLATTVNGDGVVLLDYLAVKKSCRGQGIGSKAMALMQEMYGDRGFFVEIESTRESCTNPEERRKRKDFYEAAGMVPFGVEVRVYRVRMELLGSRCRLDFEDYREFYRNYVSPRAAANVERVE